VIRESEAAYGTWHLQHQQSTARQETVKVRGMAATNDGEVAVNWALQGHGIVLRSEWEVAPLLRSGRLRQVLPEWSAQAADIHAVFLSRQALGTRTCFRRLHRGALRSLRPRRAISRLVAHGW
jgi:DNA-binding transcriptional LysR family regulator